MSDIQFMATGKWHGILRSFGLSESTLSGKHVECPICNSKGKGTPPFRFDNKGGRGTFICNNCGAGDGFKLLALYQDWDFKRCFAEVKNIVGSIESKEVFEIPKNLEKIRDRLRETWEGSRLMEYGDPVDEYLIKRGIDFPPSSLRTHFGLQYISSDKKVMHYNAMLALVRNREGKPITIHRTYIGSPKPNKKICTPLEPVKDCAIWLYPPGEILIVAEGIETALSLRQIDGNNLPCWSLISAGNMEQWRPPKLVKKVIIGGDNDESFTGQAAAWALAKKLRMSKIEVEVMVPKEPGMDWNDVLMSLQHKQ